MGRRKVYVEWHLPSTVVKIVRAVCCDYYRRRVEICRNVVQGDVLDEYVRLNKAIDVALSDIEDIFRDTILANVADGTGYDKSYEAMFMSRNAYYRRRNKFVHDVAVGLRLL